MRNPLLLLLLLLPLSLWAQRPAEIPDHRVVLTDFGGVPDGVTLNTEAFRKAISALSKRGGGQLVVPEGLWLTGPIVLKDAIDLHLEKSAVIVFTPDKSAYVEEGSGRPCISASKRHDVRISGEGIIDGNGEWWRPVKRSKNSDEEWKQYLRKGGSVTQDGSLWYPFNLKHFPNVTAGEKSEEKLRAHMIRLTDCERVTVTGVTIQNAPRFHLVPTRCRDVIIEGVTVRCPWNAQNGDGIDIMSCRHVRATTASASRPARDSGASRPVPARTSSSRTTPSSMPTGALSSARSSPAGWRTSPSGTMSFPGRIRACVSRARPSAAECAATSGSATS